MLDSFLLIHPCLGGNDVVAHGDSKVIREKFPAITINMAGFLRWGYIRFEEDGKSAVAGRNIV